jgi:hypothetical protein
MKDYLLSIETTVKAGSSFSAWDRAEEIIRHINDAMEGSGLKFQCVDVEEEDA